MDQDRSGRMKTLLLAARLAVLAGVIVAITGVGQVIAQGMETGEWEPARAIGWVVLGTLPYLGGTLTGQALRGPGDRGLKAVGIVTTLLGLVAVTIWILEGISRR